MNEHRQASFDEMLSDLKAATEAQAKSSKPHKPAFWETPNAPVWSGKTLLQWQSMLS